MATTLTGKTPAQTYTWLLHLSSGGLAAPKQASMGDGTNTGLMLDRWRIGARNGDSFTGWLEPDNLTADRIYILPDESGVLLTSVSLDSYATLAALADYTPLTTYDAFIATLGDSITLDWTDGLSGEDDAYKLLRLEANGQACARWFQARGTAGEAGDLVLLGINKLHSGVIRATNVDGNRRVEFPNVATNDKTLAVVASPTGVIATSDIPGLSTWTGGTSIGSVGTITVGTWSGTAVGPQYGGLGANHSASTGVPIFASGVVTITATTGSGSVVRATSPTLVTPNLGTPSAVTLTNATGLPVSTGLGGLGTGVATLLAATPSGTGGLVGKTSPTFTTPNIGAATGSSLTMSGALTAGSVISKSGSDQGMMGQGLLDGYTANTDIIYQATGALRFSASTTFSDGPAFQAFGGLEPGLAGQLYFDYGSSARNVSGRAAIFRSMSLSGGYVEAMRLNAAANVLIGTSSDAGEKLQVEGSIRSSDTIKTGVFTVSTLPSASARGTGAHAFVTDNNNSLIGGLGQTLTGGSTNRVPVYSDGTVWRVG